MTRRDYIDFIVNYAKKVKFEIKGNKLIYEGADCGCKTWVVEVGNEYCVDPNGMVLIETVDGEIL